MALGIALCGAFFYLLATGPISLESLKPSLTRSLEERLGAGYRVSIGPTFLMRGPSGVGLGFGGIQIRDGEGRTVVSAPGGRVGLDVVALLGAGREGAATRTGRPRPQAEGAAGRRALGRRGGRV